MVSGHTVGTSHLGLRCVAPLPTMRAMQKLNILVVGLLLGLGACSSKLDKAIKESEGWRDKMCECKNKECAEKVQTDFKAWRKEMREKFKDEKDQPSEEQKTKLMAIDKAYRDCERKAEGEGAPGGTEGAAPAAGGTEGAAPPAAPPATPPAEEPKK